MFILFGQIAKLETAKPVHLDENRALLGLRDVPSLQKDLERIYEQCVLGACWLGSFLLAIS